MHHDDHPTKAAWRRLEGEPAVERWQGIVDLIARLTDAQAVVLTRVVDTRLHILRTNDHPDNPFATGDGGPLDQHFCHQTVTIDEPMIIIDAMKLRQWRDAPEVNMGFRAYMGHPIHWPDGNVFGTLCILRNRATRWPVEERELLEEFAATLQAHLMLIYQRHELARRIEQVQAMATILPVCPCCLNPRSDDQYWHQVQQFISSGLAERLGAFGCPSCQGASTSAHSPADGQFFSDSPKGSDQRPSPAAQPMPLPLPDTQTTGDPVPAPADPASDPAPSSQAFADAPHRRVDATAPAAAPVTVSAIAPAPLDSSGLCSQMEMGRDDWFVSPANSSDSSVGPPDKADPDDRG